MSTYCTIHVFVRSSIRFVLFKSIDPVSVKYYKGYETRGSGSDIPLQEKNLCKHTRSELQMLPSLHVR